MSREFGGIVKVWEATVRKSQSTAKKRGNSFFPTMSVAHVDDDDTACEDCTVKVLSNGDMYNGQWVDNVPHGQGKYLWADGCMYVGEWFRGKTMGKGRFSWPSGATYEGEFKSGYMDGQGTYTGIGGTYKGSWVMNLKHGKGTKHYANGDYYDGEWRRGLQDGQGRYNWSNGNHYIGQWKGGKMNGNGTMIWANGNRYDGFWEDGLPKGNGTFRWADGSFYVGVWSKDPKEQNGTYYPSGSQVANLEWDPQELFSVDMNECKICPGEKVSVLPSQKMVNWPDIEGEQKQPILKPSNGIDARPRRSSVDGRLSNGGVQSLVSEAEGGGEIGGRYSVGGREAEEALGGLQLDDMDSLKGFRAPQIRIQPVKRQGETISKGHKNYELMLNLQLGIRYLMHFSK